MEYPQRDKYTFWHNQYPIEDAYEALSLLALDTTSSRPTIIQDCEVLYNVAEILRHWYREGSSGGDMSGTNYYQVSRRTFERLMAFGMIQIQTIHFPAGGSITRADEYVISAEGKRNLKEHDALMLKIAKSMLKPGIDTDLTGQVPNYELSREHFRHGEVHVDFFCPDNRTCRIYPRSRQRVECIS